MTATLPLIKITREPVELSKDLTAGTYYAQNRHKHNLYTTTQPAADPAPDPNTAPSKVWKPYEPFDLVVNDGFKDWAWTLEGEITFVVIE